MSQHRVRESASRCPSEVRTEFASPFDVPAPPGGARWRDLYTYSLPFAEHRREADEAAFWFRDTIHFPRPLRPFDAAFVQYSSIALGQANHRHLVLPRSRGLDARVLNGYCYLSPGGVDEVEVPRRSACFEVRSRFYVENWDELSERWVAQLEDLLTRIEQVSFPGLPDVVPFDEVIAGGGVGRSHEFVGVFHRLIEAGIELWQAHFALLNLGYFAYLEYFGFCRSAFPGVDDLRLADTIATADLELFRPDRELRRLARRAVDDGIDGIICGERPERVLATLAEIPAAGWLSDFEATKVRWFQYSTGSGFYSDDAVWADRLDVPMGFIADYIRRLQRGDDIDRHHGSCPVERDRFVTELRDRLEPGDRVIFDEKLARARQVFPFVENHNLYIEHRGMARLWSKVRELSSVFVDAGFWAKADDIFFLRPEEVSAALLDLLSSWAAGGVACGPAYWPPEISRRRDILRSCASSSPPAALGTMPVAVDEPLAVMLWGITPESLGEWADMGRHPKEMTGVAASPGSAVARARVVCSVDHLDELEDGEILVTELTSPSWAPVFGRAAGMVTEVGGIMCHTAIVCREYGLPAVTGVVGATDRIRSGQLLYVDGISGRVTVLD